MDERVVGVGGKVVLDWDGRWKRSFGNSLRYGMPRMPRLEMLIRWRQADDMVRTSLGDTVK